MIWALTHGFSLSADTDFSSVKVPSLSPHPFLSSFLLISPFAARSALFFLSSKLLLLTHCCSVHHLLSTHLFRWKIRARRSACTVVVSGIIFPRRTESLCSGVQSVVAGLNIEPGLRWNSLNCEFVCQHVFRCQVWLKPKETHSW